MSLCVDGKGVGKELTGEEPEGEGSMDATGARTTVKIFRRQGFVAPSDGTPLTALFEGADGTLYGTTFGD